MVIEGRRGFTEEEELAVVMEGRRDESADADAAFNFASLSLIERPVGDASDDSFPSEGEAEGEEEEEEGLWFGQSLTDDLRIIAVSLRAGDIFDASEG